MRRTRFLVCAIAVGLSACSASVPISEPIPFELDSGGVQLAESVLRIDFGRTQSSTIPAMTKLARRDVALMGACAETGVSFAEWPGGLRLIFADATFLGWEMDDKRAGQACTT